MPIERLWAGWRGEYVTGTVATGADSGCVLCRVLGASGDADAEAQSIHRGTTAAVFLNAYPYNNGHMLVAPYRHVADLTDLRADERVELWALVTDAVAAVRAAYRPGGVNVGANLGRAAGAGVPDHVHLHVLPRWEGDTTFTTTIADTRVIPEALTVSADRLRDAWPDPGSLDDRP